VEHETLTPSINLWHWAHVYALVKRYYFMKSCYESVAIPFL